MTIRFKNELLLIISVAILLIIAITLFPSSVLRVILGLPFILFLPGYMLTAALVPARNALGGIERIALSCTLSISLVAATGFILNFTRWGITLYPILISLTIFILIMSAITWLRRRRLFQEERSAFTVTLSLSRWTEQAVVNKVLSVFLAVAILGALASAGYAIAASDENDRFTEFYILGADGKAGDYPAELAVGEEAKVTAGVVNNEREDESYRIEVTIDGNINSEITDIALVQGEKWEREVFFSPRKAGENEEVRFSLYKEGQQQPYRLLRLWIDVK